MKKKKKVYNSALFILPQFTTKRNLGALYIDRTQKNSLWANTEWQWSWFNSNQIYCNTPWRFWIVFSFRGNETEIKK